jgi:hypothetical protein
MVQGAGTMLAGLIRPDPSTPGPADPHVPGTATG